MYSTDRLPKLNEKYEKIRTIGIEILSDFNNYIKELKGISENNHSDEVLWFKLFNHKIQIALWINPGGIVSQQGTFEVSVEKGGVESNLLPESEIYFESSKLMSYNGGKFSSDKFPEFVLNNIIQTLVEEYTISFFE